MFLTSNTNTWSICNPTFMHAKHAVCNSTALMNNDVNNAHFGLLDTHIADMHHAHVFVSQLL